MKRQKIKNNDRSIVKLIVAVILLAVSICFGVFIIVPVGQYRGSFIEHEDLTCVIYTYKSSKYCRMYRNQYYEINVNEEEKPLYVPEIYLPALNKKNLSALESGDIIQCYVKPCKQDAYAYELVEMNNGDTSVMSLRDFNAAGRRNAIIGFVVVPIISVTVLVCSIVYFVRYIKRK